VTMRILHVTTFLQGGAGAAITALACAQRRAGHDVRVVADAGGEAGYQSYPEYIRALEGAGVQVCCVASTFKRDPGSTRAAARRVRRLARAWPPDLLHAHAGMPAAVCRLAGLRDGPGAVPLIQTMHGWGIAKTAGQAAHDLRMLEDADALVTPSAAAHHALKTAGLRRRDVRVIPYGIDPRLPVCEPDAADVRRIRSCGTAAVALCIGTLGERKNQRLLVDALATGLLPDAAAVFIGEGDPAPLDDHAARRGVQSRVLVLGHRPDASRYLPLADALVLPSRNEGLPLAVLEALRAGVPAVATRLPEIREALAPGCDGFLFEAECPSSLARALRAAIDEPDRAALATRLRERYASRYTIDRMVGAYAALYAGMAAGVRPSAARIRGGVPQHDTIG